MAFISLITCGIGQFIRNKPHPMALVQEPEVGIIVISATMRASGTGANNTAIGHRAMKNNTSGYSNTAVGVAALGGEGTHCTAIGGLHCVI
jgi:hypothetical protein